MKVLITGITGFIGTHLAEELLRTNKYELLGTYRDAKKQHHLKNKASK